MVKGSYLAMDFLLAEFQGNTEIKNMLVYLFLFLSFDKGTNTDLEGSILMKFNANHLPKAPLLNRIVGLILHSLNTKEWEKFQ